jgi:hypothetical protein
LAPLAATVAVALAPAFAVAAVDFVPALAARVVFVVADFACVAVLPADLRAVVAVALACGAALLAVAPRERGVDFLAAGLDADEDLAVEDERLAGGMWAPMGCFRDVGCGARLLVLPAVVRSLR